MMPLLIGAVGAVLALAALFTAVISAALPDAGPELPAACQPPPGRTLAGIPAPYLALYVRAGQQYAIAWNVLAAVGKVESDHGRGTGPGIRSGTNHAGAAGPMQFLTATWAAYGIDGDRDGRRDIYNPADAIPAAARYLKHHGAPADMRRALYAYNHSRAYVDTVLRQARAYAKTNTARASDADGACGTGASSFAPLSSGVVAKAIAFARAQLGKPYLWGGEGPHAFDCSGLTWAAYRAAGIAIPRTSGEQWRRLTRIPRGSERSGDLVFFNSGPGTSTTSPGHVGLVTAPGRMIVAPRTGTRIQIQPYNRPNLLGFTRPAPDRNPADRPHGTRGEP